MKIMCFKLYCVLMNKRIVCYSVFYMPVTDSGLKWTVTN